MCGCGKDIGLEIENRTQWHSTFCMSMELELMENESGLNYEKEYSLSKEPLRIDLLIIKKNPYEKVKNELGAFFRGYNIVEFKSPDDKYHSKARAVVSLASDVNTFVFKQIILGGGKMNEELKEMLLPELGELKRLLAANQMELAGKDAELAEKDAVIAELRRRLNEAGAMP